MSIKKTFILEAQVADALKKIDNLTESVDDLGKSQKKTAKETKSMGGNFKAMGIAKITAGVALLTKFFGSLWEQMQKNQQVADTVNTVFNSIGIVFKMVTDTLINIYTAVSKSTQNFDALGRVAKNVLDIAITPLKLSFQAIKLGIQSAMLAWEKSFLGGKGKDIERIAELTESINETKQSIRDTANQALESGKEIVGDFTEAVGEITNIGKVVVDEFKETFEGVTVASILAQGKAITEAKKNYELLSLAQQRLIEQYDLEAESQRAIRDDVRLSIDERIAANNELGRVLEKQIAAEKAAVQEQIDSVDLLNQLEGETQERLEERFALETELLAIDAKVKGFAAEQLTNEAALQDERVSNLQELSTLGQTEMERQMSALEIEAENRRTLAERTISNEQELANTLLLIDQDLAAKKQEILDAEKQARQDANFQTMNQAVDVGKNILGSLAQIQQETISQQQNALDSQLEAGTISQEQYDKKSEKLRKDALKKERRNAMLQILISTAQGVAQAVKAGSGVPFPGNLLAIGTGIASVLAGIAQAKAVMSQTGEGGGDIDTGGGGGGGSQMAAGGMGALVPNMEAVEQPSLGGDTTVQAYVVENDISNSQALQQELDTQATL
jgi:hypothetical protein